MSPPDAPKPAATPNLTAPKLEAPKPPKTLKVPTAPKHATMPKTTTRPTGRRGGRTPLASQSPVMKILVPVAAVVVVVGLSVFLYERLTNSANGPHSVSVFALSVGECIVPPTQITANLSTLDVVPCHTPHTQQVFFLVHDDTAGDNYPGASELKTYADGHCLQHFQPFVGIDYQDSTLFYTYLLPSVRSWAAGDRTVTCLITTTGPKLHSSVEGSKL
jgi:hypothetical protein